MVEGQFVLILSCNSHKAFFSLCNHSSEVYSSAKRWTLPLDCVPLFSDLIFLFFENLVLPADLFLNQEKWREKYCDLRDTLSGLWQVQAARGGGVALVFAPALWWPCTPVFLVFTLVSHPFPLWVWVEPSMWEPSFDQTETPVLGKLLTTLPWTLAL